jgi:uncharacterized protein YhfF
MKKNEKNIRDFWNAFISAQENVADTGKMPEAWSFGDSKDMADELGALVRKGIKTATCSLLWEYEHDGDALPEIGELSIILDGVGEPLCLIETTEVQIRPYDQIDSQFAYEEGEGDRSLAYWRQAHWHFFSKVCNHIGREPHDSMPLICERFRVIYPLGSFPNDI